MLKREAAMIASAVALSVVVLSACGGQPPVDETSDTEAVAPAPETTAEAAVDEFTLPIEVRLAMLDEFGVDALGIDMQVQGGRVRLSGTVRNPETQRNAEQVVRAVDGVDEVYSTIAVAPSGDLAPEASTSDQLETELTDELLEGEVALRLYAELGVDAHELEVEATDGTLTISGVVDEASKKEDAVAAAEAAAGANEVIDMIQVANPVSSVLPS